MDNRNNTHAEASVFCFVDEQRFGPYVFWHHKHFFKEMKNGIMVEDHVYYALPFGVFGRMANQLLVKNKLEAIFKIGETRLKEIFGEMAQV